jgi:hypothetical protein
LPLPTHHQVSLALLGSDHDHIAGGEAGGAKSLRHGLRRRRDVAHGIGGVDLDQLLEDVVCQLIRGCVRRIAVAVRGERCTGE